jgi:hypothetical protein
MANKNLLFFSFLFASEANALHVFKPNRIKSRKN